MIYVIKTKNCHPEMIKIGYTRKSMACRIQSIKTGCPHEIDLIYAKNGSLKDEKTLHERLKDHRVRGEWFAWNKEVMAALKLEENPKPIDPSNPRSFLTPRQKQINHLFRKCTTNENFIYVQTLSMFINNHQYSEKELLEFPQRKARFIIFETTPDVVMKEMGALRRLSSEDGHEGTQRFICSPHTPSWNFRST